MTSSSTSHKPADCTFLWAADATLSRVNGENDHSDCVEGLEDQSMPIVSCNGSPVASFWGSTTTGISSMDNSERLCAVNSSGTLDELFTHNGYDEDDANVEPDIDEGHVSDAEKRLDVDVNFVINLDNQRLDPATPLLPLTPTNGSVLIVNSTSTNESVPIKALNSNDHSTLMKTFNSSDEPVSSEIFNLTDKPILTVDFVAIDESTSNGASKPTDESASNEASKLTDESASNEASKLTNKPIMVNDCQSTLERVTSEASSSINKPFLIVDSASIDEYVSSGVPSPANVFNASNTFTFIPLKHFLKPICTIGTGTFGRVELTQHKETQQYYALKSMYIPSILKRRQLNHVFNEKKILGRLKHPFIVKMFDTAKDNRNLYMILEYLAGGELFSYLRMSRSLSSSVVKFYTAEVLLALEYLHSLRIAYRDLKPENLMLCCDGHVKLTDFGFAKEIQSKSYSLCGTTAYLAPELADRSGHDVKVDCWSLGILIFELMTGYTPFAGSTIDEVQRTIHKCDGKPDFPRKTFSANSKSIISQLLSVNPEERKTVVKIKQHPWFEDVCFDELLTKNVQPPIIPTVFNEGDTGNFDSYEEIDKQPPAKQRDLDLFDEW